MTAPEQIRAARALLRLEQAELATRAHVSVVTLRRLESAEGSEIVSYDTIAKISRVLEQAGAEFIPGGVRRRPATQPDASLLADLRAISQRSAARLHDHDTLTDADLYDEAGLPA